MRVLVTTASRHGSTAEIAAEVGTVLAGAGFEVSVLPVEQAEDVERYGAVVLGSAVYAGRWIGSATRFVDHHRDALVGLPVWLFSSGPLGEPARPEGDPPDAARMVEATSARGHRVFAGRLDEAYLGFAERAIAKLVNAPSGDFRHWEEIRQWAAVIATELAAIEQPVTA
jgi:menaquinone-dependent protoporphyrinogen oxidase